MLEVYTQEAANRADYIKKAAEAYGEDDGELAWLRLYFEEVVWPAAENQIE